MKNRSLTSGTGVLLVALAAMLWGSDALFRRGLALELPPATVVFYEHLILVVVTFPLLRQAIRATRSFTRWDWVASVLVGAGASATATILFTAAFRYGDPTTPLLLQKLQPLIAVAGAVLLLRERLTPLYGVYFFGGAAGAYLITFSDPLSVSVAGLVPAALAIGAAALWALGTVLGRRLTAKVQFAPLTALRFAFGLPAAAVILWVQQGGAGFATADMGDVPTLLLLALIPGLLALLIYYRGLTRTPAAAATVAELGFPLAAVSLNFLVFGTTLSATQWLGLVILAGTITSMGLLGQKRTESMGLKAATALSPQPAGGGS